MKETIIEKDSYADQIVREKDSYADQIVRDKDAQLEQLQDSSVFKLLKVLDRLRNKK